MHTRVVESAAIAALSMLVTAIMSAPLLHAPSERVFGAEIVGRHHDPFTMMDKYSRPLRDNVSIQPVTDLPGALLARVAGPVAAYNWLVLLSFPFAAVCAYLLARQLSLSPRGAAVAGMAYAFSPFHVAQAAYHPHVAQIQWLPLYLLALWRSLDRASIPALAFLVAAALAVTLSNAYAGMIAAVITPVAVGAHWLARRRTDGISARALGLTVATLFVLTGAGATYASFALEVAVAGGATSSFPQADLVRYGARWWSYLVPPVEHPLLGTAVHRFWARAGVREGLLEQQVSLGWGVVALTIVGAWRRLTPERHPSLAHVPVLLAVALAALLWSLSPADGAPGAAPSSLLHGMLPMFRSYARFGVVVQLMTALLAGIGVDRLLRSGAARARMLAVGLLGLAGAEYVVSPSAMWRDVLPTSAHRWVVREPTAVRVLDCAPLTQESASIGWMTGGRVMLLGGVIGSCTDPDVAHALAANGYTHLLARRGSAARLFRAAHPDMEGFRLAARLRDGEVFAVTSKVPVVYTVAARGFSAREQDDEWAWRWMGREATWTVVNTTRLPVLVTVDVELSAFHQPRALEVRLDARPVQTVVVSTIRARYQLGPIEVTPGAHDLVFHPTEAPTVAADVTPGGDRRPLSFAVGRWTWILHGARP